MNSTLIILQILRVRMSAISLPKVSADIIVKATANDLLKELRGGELGVTSFHPTSHHSFRMSLIRERQSVFQMKVFVSERINLAIRRQF